MNAAKRKILDQAVALLNEAETLINDVRDLEREAFENLPESLQGAQAGLAMSDTCDNLDELSCLFDDIRSQLDPILNPRGR